MPKGNPNPAQKIVHLQLDLYDFIESEQQVRGLQSKTATVNTLLREIRDARQGSRPAAAIHQEEDFV